MARSWCPSSREHAYNKDHSHHTPPTPTRMLQPMQQLLFTSGTAASRSKKKNGEMKLASATLWHFLQSVVWVGAVDVVARLPGCPGIISSIFTRDNSIKRNTRTNFQQVDTYSRFKRNVPKKFECIARNFPISARPKIVELFFFFGALNKQKKSFKTLQTQSVHCKWFFSLKKKNLRFLFIFLEFFFCEWSRAASSSRHRH